MSIRLANPAPLGLLGFGLTTVLFNMHNANFFPLNTMLVAMGLAYGGLAQIIVGIMEFRRGNTFGTVAFTSYGLFWWSFVLLLIMPHTTFFTGMTVPSGAAMASYFFMWGLFTVGMFAGTFKTSKALQFVFLTVTVLFFLLTLRDTLGSTTIGIIAGYEGIICGLSAVYLGIAEVLNETYRKTILPIGVKS